MLNIVNKIIGREIKSPNVVVEDHNTIKNTAIYGILFKLTDKVKLIKQDDYEYYKEQMVKNNYIQITNNYLYYPIAMSSNDVEEYKELQEEQGLIEGIDFVTTNIIDGMYLEHLDKLESWINEINFTKK